MLQAKMKLINRGGIGRRAARIFRHFRYHSILFAGSAGNMRKIALLAFVVKALGLRALAPAANRSLEPTARRRRLEHMGSAPAQTEMDAVADLRAENRTVGARGRTGGYRVDVSRNAALGPA
jgi:hypothetical protein